MNDSNVNSFSVSDWIESAGEIADDLDSTELKNALALIVGAAGAVSTIKSDGWGQVGGISLAALGLASVETDADETDAAETVSSNKSGHRESGATIEGLLDREPSTRTARSTVSPDEVRSRLT
jgi:hypothetical protein